MKLRRKCVRSWFQNARSSISSRGYGPNRRIGWVCDFITGGGGGRDGSGLGNCGALRLVSGVVKCSSNLLIRYTIFSVGICPQGRLFPIYPKTFLLTSLRDQPKSARWTERSQLFGNSGTFPRRRFIVSDSANSMPGLLHRSLVISGTFLLAYLTLCKPPVKMERAASSCSSSMMVSLGQFHLVSVNGSKSMLIAHPRSCAIARIQHFCSQIGSLTFPRRSSPRTSNFLKQCSTLFLVTSSTFSQGVCPLLTSRSKLTYFAHPIRSTAAPRRTRPTGLGSRRSQGEVPQAFSFPFSQVEPLRLSEGTFKYADSTNFPVSKTLAMTEVTIEPGAMRELHVS